MWSEVGAPKDPLMSQNYWNSVSKIDHSTEIRRSMISAFEEDEDDNDNSDSVSIVSSRIENTNSSSSMFLQTIKNEKTTNSRFKMGNTNNGQSVLINLKKSSKHLSGIVALVETEAACAMIVTSSLRRLGAVISTKLGDDVTHFVFYRGKLQKLRRAQKMQQRRTNFHIVSVLWVQRCEQRGRRVFERDYPIFLDENDLSSYSPIQSPELGFVKCPFEKRAKTKALVDYMNVDEQMVVSDKRVKALKRRKVTQQVKRVLNEFFPPSCDSICQINSSDSVQLQLLTSSSEQSLIGNDDDDDDKNDRFEKIMNKLNDRDKVVDELIDSPLIDRVRIGQDKETACFTDVTSRYGLKGKARIKTEDSKDISWPSVSRSGTIARIPLHVYSSPAESVCRRVGQMKIKESVEKNKSKGYAVQTKSRLLNQMQRGQSSGEEFIRPKARSYHPSVSSRNHRPTIVITSLPKNELGQLWRAVAKLGRYQLARSVDDRTWAVVSDGRRRTLSVLKAVVRGCPILSIQWIYQSIKASKWLPERSFQMHDWAPAIAKRQEDGGRSKLFHGLGYFYVGLDCSPPANDLKELIVRSGGKVSESMPRASIFVQSHRTLISDRFILENGSSLVSEKWILDSIMQNQLQKMDQYAI